MILHPRVKEKNKNGTLKNADFFSFKKLWRARNSHNLSLRKKL